MATPHLLRGNILLCGRVITGQLMLCGVEGEYEYADSL